VTGRAQGGPIPPGPLYLGDQNDDGAVECWFPHAAPPAAPLTITFNGGALPPDVAGIVRAWINRNGGIDAFA
jgi:hypothetical protein